jgi:opacity protein-like surface antigen
VPYLGGGIGATYYKLKQEGDFVDKGDPNVMGDETIFTDVFVSDGWGFSQHVFLGLDVKLTKNLGLILEGRYDWAKADIEGSFVGFDPIDLNGAKILIGVNWRL